MGFLISGGMRMRRLRLLGLMLCVVLAAGGHKLFGTESLRSTQDIRYPDLPRGITSFGAAVIGGMRQKGGPTTRVDVYDPASGQWSQAPSLIDPKADADRGKGMEGFGSSAFTVEGRLLVSTYNGNIQVLDEENDAWQISAKLVDDRFFHRMLPFNGRLLLVGGASMRVGKRLHFETVELSSLK